MLMPFVVLTAVFPAIVLVDLVKDRMPWNILTAPQIGGIISSLSLPACVFVGGLLALSPAREKHRKRPVPDSDCHVTTRERPVLDPSSTCL
jgi:hypothetical protein